MIPVTPEDYAHYVKCAAAIEFLGRRGACWRDADQVEGDWKIGDETEWAYSTKYEPLVDRILRHRATRTPVPESPPCPAGCVQGYIQETGFDPCPGCNPVPESK